MATVYKNVFGTTFRKGRYVFKATIGSGFNVASGDKIGIGLGTSSSSWGGLNNFYIGQFSRECTFWGNVVLTSATDLAAGAYTGTNFAAGDVITVAMDNFLRLVWFKLNNGNWNNSGTADPATGVGGLALSAFNNNPIIGVSFGTEPGRAISVTLDPNPSTGIPAGFAAWGDDIQFYQDQVDAFNILTPGLYTDADTFYTPQVNRTAPISYYIDPDTFYVPTVVKGAAIIAPALYTDGDVFYVPAVTAGVVGLVAGRYDNTNTFNTHTLTRGAVNLSPALLVEGNGIFSPTLSVGAVDLAPGLYTDGDTFYTQILTQGGGLESDRYDNANTFYTHTIQILADANLAPDLFGEINTIYSPSLINAQVLLPIIYNELNTFYIPNVVRGSVNLSPIRYTDGDTFFTHVLTSGTVALVPARYNNTNTFFTHTLTAPGAQQSLTAGLYSDADSFFVHTVSRGAVNLNPSFYLNSGAIANTGAIPPTAGSNIVVGSDAWSNPGGITADDSNNASINHFVAVALISDILKGNSFNLNVPSNGVIDGIELTVQLSDQVTSGTNPTIASVNIAKDDSTLATPKTPGTAITPTSVNYTFGSPTDKWGLAWTPAEVNAATFQGRLQVNIGNGIQSINCDVMFAKVYYHTDPTVFPASLASVISAGLYTDADSIFPPIMGAFRTLVAARYNNTNTFFTPILAGGVANVIPGLFTNDNTFYAHFISTGDSTIAPDLYVDDDVIYTPTIVGQGNQTLNPGFNLNNNTFFNQNLDAARVRREFMVQYF